MLALRRLLFVALPSVLLTTELAVAAGSSAGSPFMPAAGAAQVEAAPTQDAQLELRGIMGSGDTTLFSIYDSTRRTSYWTRLNDAGHEFVVRSYDAGRDLVTVEYQGRTLTLALKTAKVASAPVNMPLPMPQPQGQFQPPIGGPVVLNPTPADEQRRLEAIAAEVNRRRMVRQQALQANRMPGAPGGQPPGRTNPQR